MSDRSPGLLERLGPLGFLVLIVLVAAAFLFYRGGDNAPVPQQSLVATPADGDAVEASPASAQQQAPTAAAESESDALPVPNPATDTVAEGDNVETTAPAAAAADNGDEQAPSAADDGNATAAGTDVPGAGMADDGDASGSETPAAEAAAAAAYRVGDLSKSLMDRARELFSGQSLFADDADIDDRARTALVEIVDALTGEETLAIGIAARLDQADDADDAARRAEALRDFFSGHGIDTSRIVAGVLVPEYHPADGAERQVEFFFAERAEP